jgi:two-component system, chemotaxis family, sensor kinase CheA
MNEFLEQFLIEARELVEQGTSDLLALERAPSVPEALDGAFRAFHTLKGGASIVDFAAMSRAAHAAEDALATVRAGVRPVTSTLIDDCLGCLDQVARWLDQIQNSGLLPADAEADADGIVAGFAHGADSPKGAMAEPVGSDVAPASSSANLPLPILKEQLLLLEVGGEGWDGRMASAGRLAGNVLRHLGRTEEADEIARALSESLDRRDRAPLATAIERAMERVAERALPAAAAVVPTELLSRTLRVDVERVGALINLTGELTVAKNAVGHIARMARDGDNALAGAITDEHVKLDRLIGGLQQAVLELRVLPLRTIFQRFFRPVREMSESLGRQARLVTEGDDTEADRSVVEALFEPLLHVIRNAIDHGVEPGPERASAGKPAVATIHLRARREGEYVVVEVEDDGRGVDKDRIRRAALERGIASAESLATMSEEEIVNLIFVPGFSTAARVTDLSGRGVGMDAVRVAVERVGGRVEVQSRRGAGSLVRFILPFSVMMTRVMTVEAGGQMFGIPMDAIVETVCVRRAEIHPVGQAQAFVLRNRAVPLIELGQTLGHGAATTEADATVVVASSGGLFGGLKVDRLGERMDVMLKPPDNLLSGVPEIAGTTVLGDGSVLLILDLQEVLQ